MKVFRAIKAFLGTVEDHEIVAAAAPVVAPDALAERLGHAKPSSLREHLGKTSAIGPAPKYPTTTPTNAPPALASAIQKARTQ